MATIRESLKKLVEVAKPVPGDEQEFVAKHGMQVLDFQGKDSLSAESPYDHILKNVAAIKKPGDPGKEDHGHDAPGESEAAYHIPESREEKIAKLSMMMEATIDPKEQQLADNLKSLLAETFSLYLKSHHYHWNVMGPDFAQYHDFLGELYKEVHGAVDMIAESIRVLGELAPGNLGSQDVSTYTNPLMMVNDLMMDNEKVIASLNNSYKLAESMNRLGISNFLQDRLTAHEKHHWMLQAISGIKGEEPMQEAKKQVVGVEMHYAHATKKPFKVTHFSVQDAERGRKEYEKMGYKLKGKKAQMGEAVTDYNPPSQGGTRKELLAKLKQTKDPKHAEAARKAGATQDELKSAMKEEMKPLLPKQKQIARDLLKKEMEDRKKQRNDNRQAGTPKITESEEDRREKNDKEREMRVATPRPHTSNDLEGMRYRLQAVKKQIIDKT
jgi:starvation-inducible DNA-binding protein